MASSEPENNSVTSMASNGVEGWTIDATPQQTNDKSNSIEEASSSQIHLEFAPVAYNRN